MTAFVWLFLLSLMWAALTEDFTLGNLCVGFVLGYVILLASQHVLRVGGFVAKLPRFIAFLFFFLWELLLANLRVAYDVITPTYHMRPGVIAVPLDARTDFEITSLAALISLTPGTLSLDVSADRSVLYVYTMFIHDRDRIVRDIKDRFERRVLEILR